MDKHDLDTALNQPWDYHKSIVVYTDDSYTLGQQDGKILRV